MTIKTKCVINHLKHDYTQIGKAFGCVAVIATVFFAGVVATNSYLIITPLAALVAPHLTALNLLNATLSVIALRYTIGIAVFGDESSFVQVTEETSEFDGSKIQKRVDYKNTDVLMEPLLLGALLLTFYCIPMNIAGLGWEFPTLSILIFTIIVIVCTPIGCAVARCKE